MIVKTQRPRAALSSQRLFLLFVAAAACISASFMFFVHSTRQEIVALRAQVSELTDAVARHTASHGGGGGGGGDDSPRAALSNGLKFAEISNIANRNERKEGKEEGVKVERTKFGGWPPKYDENRRPVEPLDGFILAEKMLRCLREGDVRGVEGARRFRMSVLHREKRVLAPLISKCASSSQRVTVMNDTFPSGFTLEEASILDEEYAGWWNWIMIREPWDRVISGFREIHFRCHRIRNWLERMEAAGVGYMCNKQMPNTEKMWLFIRDTLQRKRFLETHVYPFRHWIARPEANGVADIGYVGMMEHFRHHMNNIIDHLALNPVLKQKEVHVFKTWTAPDNFSALFAQTLSTFPQSEVEQWCNLYESDFVCMGYPPPPMCPHLTQWRKTHRSLF